MGSKSGEQQQMLIEREGVIQEGIAAQRRLEERMALAVARGASEDEIDAINQGIQSAKETRQAAQDELELIQAGLDEAAIERAEFNTETMLDALKAGFEYDPETDTFSANEGKQKIDQNVSKLLGFASDQFGNQINGADGQPLQIDSESNIEWGSFKDRFGNTVFYNKANPSEQKRANQSKVFTQEDGSTSSSPTSDSSDMQTVGTGDTYTRDNGSQGLLGENCVKYARTVVPNLPFGLVSKENKADAIAFAEDEGFGSTDATQAQVGDAILTSEGSWGHAAVVSGIDPETGELILNEANYKSGQVTEGRRIAANDSLILGFISSSTQPQMSSVINEQGNGEGNNAGIDTQVTVEATDVPKIVFSATRENEFAKYEKDPSFIPLSVGNEAQLEQFYNEYEVWRKQTKLEPVKLDPTDTFKFTRELRKDFELVAKEPKKALAQVNIIRNAFERAKADLAAGKGINASSQAILVSFQKILDPTSVVRESEYARSGDGQSLRDQAFGIALKWKQGGAGVTLEGLQEFKEASDALLGGYENSLIDLSVPITTQADKFGLDKNEILTPEVLKLIERGVSDSSDEFSQQRTQLQKGEILIQTSDGQVMAVTEEDILPSDKRL